MRVWSRIALVILLLVCSAPTLTADHLISDCPLSLVSTAPQPLATELDASPHGVFRSGTTLYVLRGNILSTYATTDVGDITASREDQLQTLVGREKEAAVAFSNGFLYISGEGGLEVFDLRNVKPGSDAAVPLPVRRAGFHYRRLAISGNRLAGLFPLTDMPCYPYLNIPQAEICSTKVDIFNIATPTNPTFLASIDSRSKTTYRGFNDIAFNFGYLFLLDENGLFTLDITNPASPTTIFSEPYTGKWLVSNGTDFIAVGSDYVFKSFRVAPNTIPFLSARGLNSIAQYLTIDRSNSIRFNRNAFYDDAAGRFITLVEEIDQMTLQPARTIAFDVFDFTVPAFEGAAERIYENVTETYDNEVKYNPLPIGPYIYTVGSESGLQSWGACGQVTGQIELDNTSHLPCGGTEIHGWVTGAQRILSVELFLDNTSLGTALIGGPQRTNISSKTPVFNWRVRVELDQTARGEHVLRAIGTDALGNRRQFASKRLFFAGPGQNCVVPRRRAVGS